MMDDDTLWAGLQAYVHATMGSVGITKMLGARGEQDAARRWGGRVRPMLEALVELVPVTSVGSALFAVDDRVEVQFDIHKVVVHVDDVPRVRTMIAFDAAAVVLGVVAAERWGERWTDFVLTRGVRRTVVRRDGQGVDAEIFPWVAQKPGTPGPWTAGASEQDATLAGMAEDLGFSQVASMFEEFARND